MIRESRILSLPPDSESFPFDPGYEAFFVPGRFDAEDGDMLVRDGRRHIVVQVSSTSVEYIGMQGPPSRTVLMTRPMAAISTQ